MLIHKRNPASAILLASLGWAMSWGIGFVGWPVSVAVAVIVKDNYEVFPFIASFIGLPIGGMIGGLVTALNLRRMYPAIHWKQLFMIACGWSLGLFIGGIIGLAAGRAIGHVMISLEVILIGLPIGWVIGGTVSALAFRWSLPAVQWRRILIIVAGWTIGLFMGEGIGFAGGIIGLIVTAIMGAIGFGVMNFVGGVIGLGTGFIISLVIYFISFVIGGGIAGFIGSSVMFWQLSQVANI